MKQLPSLTDLRVFVVAAQLEGFSLAADQLRVSPAYVSKRIALLEQVLGVTLFVRSARQVRLSLEGKIAMKWAQRLLENMEQMQLEISREHQVPKGRVRVVTSTGFGSFCVAPLLSKLIYRYPELEVDLELLDRPVDLVSEGFDLELRVGGLLPQSVIARRLATNRRVLCASPAYIEQHGSPQSLEELHKHRCISIRERDQTAGQWLLHGPSGSRRLELRAPMSTNNGAVAKLWCLDGQGIMLRSAWNIKEELVDGRLIQVLPEFSQEADIHAIYSTRLETSAKLRACVNLLEEALSEQ
ncbi:LysR family transcriptional regulator [Marinobacterium lutimaris]|uniref:Transcriptional regulator, LysR family n=1 Tax=Marinobacterium lutimaris TaxID=568106 RepID=A0A1H6AMT4_9GAMM|nr:LysR family transcriptional regulator [Marinobacterium lutimaris]SEG50028.1 transcriptional regulator, LysR family [Marinobacterium lutimaris]